MIEKLTLSVSVRSARGTHFLALALMNVGTAHWLMLAGVLMNNCILIDFEHGQRTKYSQA
jgi:hypothetical protein